MSRIILNTKIWLFVLLFGMSFPAWAQSDDFTTWTKFKVNHKIDSRFSVSGDLELRMKDDVSRLDRWGLTVGGSYRPCSFLNLGWDMKPTFGTWVIQNGNLDIAIIYLPLPPFVING